MADKAAYIGAGLLKGFARGGEHLAKRSLEQEEREAEALRQRSLAEFQAELNDTYAQKREDRAYERDKGMVDYRNEAKKGQISRTITRVNDKTGKEYQLEVDAYGNPVTDERLSGVSEGLLSGGSGSEKDIKLGDIPNDVLNDPLLQRVVKDEEGNPIPDMKTGKPMTETNWGEVSQIRDMMTQYGIRDWRQGVLLYKREVKPKLDEQRAQMEYKAIASELVNMEPGEAKRKLESRFGQEEQEKILSNLPKPKREEILTGKKLAPKEANPPAGIGPAQPVSIGSYDQRAQENAPTSGLFDIGSSVSDFFKYGPGNSRK